VREDRIWKLDNLRQGNTLPAATCAVAQGSISESSGS
jgi:hypothetical protein